MHTMRILAAVLCLAATPAQQTRCLAGISDETGRRPSPYLIDAILAETGPVDGGLILSLISVESSFQANARSSVGAAGLMQVTRGAMIDGAAWCGLPTVSLASLYIPAINVRYGSCYLRMWLAKTGSEMEALIGYNGGYRQWMNYRAGKPLARETANYIVSVRKLRENYCSTK